jgi:hypothetical protein
VNLLRSIATALALLPVGAAFAASGSGIGASGTAAAPVMTIAAAGTTGLNIALDSGFSGYTLYSPNTWGNLQAGGYVQYTLNAPVAGTYGLQVYYATTMKAGANVLVNGTQQSTLSMASTGSWGTYTMSPSATVILPAGNSVIRIAAQSTFTAFNLEGMAMTAIATGGRGGGVVDLQAVGSGDGRVEGVLHVAAGLKVAPGVGAIEGIAGEAGVEGDIEAGGASGGNGHDRAGGCESSADGQDEESCGD